MTDKFLSSEHVRQVVSLHQLIVGAAQCLVFSAVAGRFTKRALVDIAEQLDGIANRLRRISDEVAE